MYQTYLKGKSRCSICFEPKIEGKGLFEVLLSSPFLCKKCNFRVKYKRYKNLEIEVETFFEYRDEFRTALLQFKESRDRFLAPIFIHPIYLDLYTRFHDYIFVCAPSRKESYVQRGFQHLELMLEIYGFKTVEVLINNSEVDQTQSKNRESICDNIFLIDPHVIKGKKVVLFDDVMTSGSTIRSCYDLLEPYCKKIKIIVLSNSKK